MKRYPALHLEIAESAAGPSSSNWPVVQNFPPGLPRRDILATAGPSTTTQSKRLGGDVRSAQTCRAAKPDASLMIRHGQH